MGFLTDGSTLTWQQIVAPISAIHVENGFSSEQLQQQHQQQELANNTAVRVKIQTDGISQFLSIWNKYKTRAQDPFKWGDEVHTSLLLLLLLPQPQ
jgi:hypothetical protein